MDEIPENPLEQLLHTLRDKLQQHEELPKLFSRIALIAVSAVMAYLGIDIGDVDEEEH